MVEVQKLEFFFAIFAVRAWELSRSSRACSWDRRVAGSIPPWSAGWLRKAKAVTFKYESSTRSPLPQLEPENRKF